MALSAFVVAMVGLPTVAEAYCISMTCPDGASQNCDGEDIPEGCALIRWKSGCVGFSIQRDGYSKLDASHIDALARTAFFTWANQDCGGGTGPGLVAQDLGEVTCDQVEFNNTASGAGNANIIMVREKVWTHPPTAGHNIALTTTTFDPETGELLDADMEINAADFDLTTGDANVDYDLLSVLTHETGHFFGLAHSNDPDATMRPTYSPGNTDLRHPIADDATAICALYPIDPQLNSSCNPLPKHGFSQECAAEQVKPSCSLSRASTSDDDGVTGVGAITLGVLLAASGRMRRRARFKARSESLRR